VSQGTKTFEKLMNIKQKMLKFDSYEILNLEV